MKTIFVSSTFKDMHFERDAIQDKVLPVVNEAARRYGQSVSFCDLRWGISTEELESEDGSRKVLEVCLDEIDRCDPPMVVILGERYGWIPSDDLIADAAAYKKLQLDHLKKSVTALEIEYGALKGSNATDRTLFYFREITNHPPEGYGTEDAEHATLLAELKERICRLTGGRVHTYRVTWEEERQAFAGMDDFAQMLSGDLMELLRPEWEEQERMTPHERERRTHLNFVEEKGRGFCARQTLAGRYLQQIRSGQKLTIIRGEPGTGKSTLLSYLALALEKEGYETLPLICGLTLKSSTSADLIRQMVYEMECRLKLPHFWEERGAAPAEEEWRKRLDELCTQYAAADRHLVFLVDAADQLLPDEAREKLFFVPDQLSEHVQFVMTCLADFPVGGYAYSVLGVVDEQEKREIIESILASHGRELSSGVKDAIVKKRASGYPLYLSMLIQRLIMMNKQDFDRIVQAGDGMDAITIHQTKIVEECGDSAEELSVELIRVAGERIGGTFAEAAAEYIAVSRYGLRTDDLSGLLGENFRMLDFAHLVSYMSGSFLLREDGRYDFAHKSIRSGFLAQCGEPETLYRTLEQYFDTLPDGDEVKDREFTYFCIMAGDKKRFTECVTRYNRERQVSEIQLSNAARNLYATSLADRGAWLFSLMDEMDGRDESRRFFWFINDDYQECFEDSVTDRGLLKEVREHALWLTERICREAGETVSGRRALAAACTAFSHSCKDGETGIGERSCLRERALLIWRELLAEDGKDVANKRGLALALRLAGLAGLEQKSSGAEEEALRQLKEALSLRREILKEAGKPADKRMLADSCDDLADLYRGDVFSDTDESRPDGVKRRILSAKERDRKAFELHQEALSLRREAFREEPSEYGRGQLSFSYESIAGWYLSSGVPESAEEARKLYEEEIVLLKENAVSQRTANDYIRLARAAHNAGRLLAYANATEEQQRAAALCREAVMLQDRVVKMLGTPENRWQLARYQLTLADILIRCGDAAGRKTAEKLLREAAEALEELTDAQHGGKDDELAKAYRLRGDLMRENGGEAESAVQEWHRRSADVAETPEEAAYSFAEILELLGYMEEEVISMIPVNMVQMFRDKALATYQKHLDPSLSLEEQQTSGKTDIMLTLLFTRYMADDEELTGIADTIDENDRKEREGTS